MSSGHPFGLMAADFAFLGAHYMGVALVFPVIIPPCMHTGGCATSILYNTLANVPQRFPFSWHKLTDVKV